MTKTITTLTLCLFASSAFAGWGTGDWAGKYYINEATVDAVDSSDQGSFVKIMAGEVSASTIKTFTAADGQSITVAHNDSSGAKHENVTGLTITTLSGENLSLAVDAGQTLTLGGLSGSLSSITVGGTLNLVKNGEGLTGFNSFTLGANGVIGGIYNLGSSFSGDVTFTLSDEGVVTAALATGSNYEKQLTGETWNVEKIGTATLNVGDYANGGLVFKSGDTYYASAAWDSSGTSVTLSNAVSLAEETAYVVANLNGNTVSSLSALVTASAIPEPSAFGLLAGAGALALVASRRRRNKR